MSIGVERWSNRLDASVAGMNRLLMALKTSDWHSLPVAGGKVISRAAAVPRTRKGDIKSSSTTQNEERTCMDINDSPSMSRKAFDTWTMSPAESILNLSKERGKSKDSGSDDGGTFDDVAHTSTHACTRASIQPYLPSAVPPGRYPVSASAGQGAQDVGAYEQFAEQWCRKQGLSNEFVRSRMDDVFGSLLPHSPPQASDRLPEL
mmetsp:Transcript_18743/g.37571  ORF Transcript_18743/g.37571 Transcript_18743/m.37571 type:complete len:205 (-) Transcript_18743:192-806(-)